MPTTYNLAPTPIWNVLDNTGVEASNGTISTFEDTARSTPKAAYQDKAGLHPYTNPIQLDSTGSIGPIYWANDSDYYLVIKDSTGNIIKSVQHYNAPNDGGSSPITHIEQEENYLYNGQFLLNSGTISTFVAGTPKKVAEGGWEFIKNVDNASDSITFPVFNPGDATPEANPVHSFQLDCTVAGTGETEKDLRFKIPKVRIFENTEMTLSVDLKSSVGDNIELRALQDFGTGGSTAVDTGITTFAVTAAWTKFTYSFTIPSIGGKTIGTEGDDALYIIFRLPLDTAITINVVNAKLQAGDTATAYQPYPSNKTHMQAMGSQIPQPASDGSDDYTYLSAQNDTLVWATDGVGLIYPWPGTKSNVPKGYLLCNGDPYVATGKSSDNIPYSRLFSVLSNRYGSGSGFCSGLIKDNDPTNGFLFNNSAGAVTNAAAGTTPFAITVPIPGDVNPHLVVATISDQSSVFYLNQAGGTDVTSPEGGSTTFAVSTLKESSGPYATGSRLVARIACTVPTAGQYWTVGNFYFWYTVSGAGTDPAVAGLTGVEVPILTGDSATTVAVKTAAVVNGSQLSQIVYTDGASLTGGNHFTFSTVWGAYYVWYTKDGAGTDPAVTGTAIPVGILASDTDQEIAAKTSNAISNYYFQVPDLRGYFIRGLDDGKDIDQDGGIRIPLSPFDTGEVHGSEWDTNLSHRHDLPETTDPNGTDTTRLASGAPNPPTPPVPSETSYVGNYESRPVNIGMYYIIKY